LSRPQSVLAAPPAARYPDSHGLQAEQRMDDP
jgi:hypothetical protein